MIEVIGDGLGSDEFLYFRELVLRGFLVARQHADTLEAMVGGFADSGLPCFEFSTTLSKVCRRWCTSRMMCRWFSRVARGWYAQLHSRFLPGLDAQGVCKDLDSKVTRAANKYTTRLYDTLQLVQNNIAM